MAYAVVPGPGWQGLGPQVSLVVDQQGAAVLGLAGVQLWQRPQESVEPTYQTPLERVFPQWG